LSRENEGVLGVSQLRYRASPVPSRRAHHYCPMIRALQYSITLTIAFCAINCGGSASETPFPQQPPPEELKSPPPTRTKTSPQVKPTKVPVRGDAGASSAPQF